MMKLFYITMSLSFIAGALSGVCLIISNNNLEARRIDLSLERLAIEKHKVIHQVCGDHSGSYQGNTITCK